MIDLYFGERKIILNEMIHGNVLVKIHGEIKKNDKNELHLQNAQCFKIALYEMLALKFKGVVMLFIENSYGV
jgi:molybdopterin biosynthesis enzyme